MHINNDYKTHTQRIGFDVCRFFVKASDRSEIFKDRKETLVASRDCNEYK